MAEAPAALKSGSEIRTLLDLWTREGHSAVVFTADGKLERGNFPLQKKETLDALRETIDCSTMEMLTCQTGALRGATIWFDEEGMLAMKGANLLANKLLRDQIHGKGLVGVVVLIDASVTDDE